MHPSGCINGCFRFNGAIYYAKYTFCIPEWNNASFKEQLYLYDRNYTFTSNTFFIEEVTVVQNVLYFKMEQRFVPKRYISHNYDNFEDLRVVRFATDLYSV